MENLVKPTIVCLSGRYYIYRLLHRVFSGAPDISMLKVITGKHTDEVLELLLGKESARNVYLSLEPIRAALSANAEGILLALSDEYTSLLIGPSDDFVPPWASVYNGGDRTLFQESTLQVRRKYFQHHLQSVNYPHEADDHIALELDFMTVLSRLSLDCFEQQRMTQFKELIDEQRSFLTQHMLTWLPAFSEKLQSSGRCVLYPLIAALTCQILCADSALLREIAGTQAKYAQE